jgi:BolA protein
MNITSQQLHQRLSEQLNPDFLEVLDESAAHAGHAGANASGQGTHFRVRIDCAQFIGKTRILKHRLVYDALAEYMAQGLHALAIEVIDNTTRAHS